MRILMIASEMVPFAKTGGLADVVGALPKVISRLGHEVRTIIPKYQMVRDDNLKPIVKTLEIEIGKHLERAAIKASLNNGNLAYFVAGRFFDRQGLYGDQNGDYKDNDERFIFFSKAVLDLLKVIDYQPDVIHCHDWQSGLVPVYLRTLYRDDPFYARSATLFTIHNLAYQGLFPRDRFSLTDLPQGEFTPQRLEFYDQVSFLKGGLIYSDIINTVSRYYAHQIQTPEYGERLDGVLRSRREVLFGVLNGLDYDEWDPAQDKLIFKRYDSVHLKAKAENKIGLLKEQGLSTEKELPLIGIVSRLAAQKGFDLLAEVIDELMALPLQMVILGTGERSYHDLFMDMAKRYPDRLGVNLTYDNALAHKIYAGSDIFLMPSRYEPCGLGQLISLRYGTIPVVRATGGLKDTISEFDPISGSGNGFVFEDYSATALFAAIKRALSIYREEWVWKRLMENGMKEDFSWNASGNEYLKLYELAISRHRLIKPQDA